MGSTTYQSWVPADSPREAVRVFTANVKFHDKEKRAFGFHKDYRHDILSVQRSEAEQNRSHAQSHGKKNLYEILYRLSPGRGVKRITGVL
jgi:hypothetical protein